METVDVSSRSRMSLASMHGWIVCGLAQRHSCLIWGETMDQLPVWGWAHVFGSCQGIFVGEVPQTEETMQPSLASSYIISAWLWVQTRASLTFMWEWLNHFATASAMKPLTIGRITVSHPPGPWNVGFVFYLPVDRKLSCALVLRLVESPLERRFLVVRDSVSSVFLAIIFISITYGSNS